MDAVEELYEHHRRHSPDITEHMPTLLEYAKQCQVVTEFGVRHGSSTSAFLHARPALLTAYDITIWHGQSALVTASGQCGLHYQFIQASSLDVEIAPTDLLFIDTMHDYVNCIQELMKHGDKAAKFIILHDTETFGTVGGDGKHGLKLAIMEFLQARPREWMVARHDRNQHGLTVLERINPHGG